MDSSILQDYRRKYIPLNNIMINKIFEIKFILN
jgi:hypothetical protein